MFGRCAGDALGDDKAAEHPAKLTAWRLDLVPGFGLAIVRGDKSFLPHNLHQLARLQLDLPDVVHIAELAAHVSDHVRLRDFCQVVLQDVQLPAGDPRVAVCGRPNGVPTARIVAVNLHFRAAPQLVGGIVVLTRAAADIDIVGIQIGLVGELLGPTANSTQQNPVKDGKGASGAHGEPPAMNKRPEVIPA